MKTTRTESRLALEQLKVAEPCHESWDGMRPLDESRRHCNSCSKAVIDLSTLSRAEAERVIVLMGSGTETVHETVDALTARGDKVGVLKVRLYRPFAMDLFVRSLPPTVTSIAVCSIAPRSPARPETRCIWTSWPRSWRHTPRGRVRPFRE